jgi:hypothetical protein
MKPDDPKLSKKLAKVSLQRISDKRKIIIAEQNTMFGMTVFAKAEIVFHAKEMEDEWGNTTQGPDGTEYKLLTTVIKRKTRAALEKIKRELTDGNVDRFLTRQWNAMKQSGKYDNVDFPGFVSAGSGPIEQINIDIQIREYFAPKVFEIDYNSAQRVQDECGIQFLIDGLKGAHGFQTMTRDAVRKEFGAVIRVSDIMTWVKSRGIGLTLIDALNEQYCYIPKDETHKASPHLYGKLNNDHITLISNESIISSIRYKSPFKAAKADWRLDVKYEIVGGFLGEIYGALTEFTPEENKQSVLIVESICDISLDIELSMNDLINEIFKKENLEVSNIRLDNMSNVKGFSYKSIFVEFNKDVRPVLTIIDQMKTIKEIKFTNQSLKALMNDCMEYDLPCNTMSDQTWEIFKQAPFSGLIHCPEAPRTEIYELDFSKAYSTCFRDPLCDRYFYKEESTFKPVKVQNVSELKPGHYIVKKIDHHMLNQEMLLTDELVKRYHAMGILDLNDVVSHILPHGVLNKTVFHKIAKQLDSLPIDMKHRKLMMNSFIGVLGIMDNKSYKAGLVNSLQTAIPFLNDNRTIHMISKPQADPRQLPWEAPPASPCTLFMLIDGKSTPKYDNHRTLFHDIVNENTYKLIWAEKSAQQQGATVFGYRIDAIYHG